MLAGRRILPPSELNGPLAQLCETAFYMGASFVAGQVHGTLELDDAECDELTRETFLILLNSAIAAMQTSGAMLIAQGDDSVEP